MRVGGVIPWSWRDCAAFPGQDGLPCAPARPNLRSNLPSGCLYPQAALDFFRPERFFLKPLSGLTVLEVKYDAFLPDLVRMAVQIPNRRAAACSKYALCRRYD